MNFWKQLKTPFLVLAPMDDVTDHVFRQVVTRAAAPEVLFTEFVSTDGLQSAGRARTLERLMIEPGLTRPLVAQIWGSDPDHYYESARDIAGMGFAGIDINLGCPERKIVARGCCGGLIGNTSTVSRLIEAVRAGAPNLPVSVKTRIGLGSIITEEWAGFLLTQRLDALTIHGRTVKEMSRVPARWDEIAKVVALRNQLGVETVIIGNGDAPDRAHSLELASATGVDGVMIGRGIFHNIFAFDATPKTHSPAEQLDLLKYHLSLYAASPHPRSFEALKKFFKVYALGWPGASQLRADLMNTHTPTEALMIVQGFEAELDMPSHRPAATPTR